MSFQPQHLLFIIGCLSQHEVLSHGIRFVRLQLYLPRTGRGGGGGGTLAQFLLPLSVAGGWEQ